MKRTITIAAGALAIILVGCSGSPATPSASVPAAVPSLAPTATPTTATPTATPMPTPTPVAANTLQGTIKAIGAYNSGYNGVASQLAHCVPDGGYSDVVEGIDVVVTDETGKTIGASRLMQANPAFSQFECHFVFTVENLPKAAFYKLSVGRRGAPTYSYSDLVAAGWKTDLNLGGQ
jgi:glucose/arabinose dehydrogenase